MVHRAHGRFAPACSIGPIVPNSTDLDPTFGQFQMVGEIERRYALGSARQGRGDRLSDPRAAGKFPGRGHLAALTGSPPTLRRCEAIPARPASPPIWSSRSCPASACSRAPATPTATWRPMHFTDVDRTVADRRLDFRKVLGPARRHGSGIAGVVNMITKQHQAYSRRRRLTRIRSATECCLIPVLEEILETYYSFRSIRGSSPSTTSSSPILPTTAIEDRFRWSRPVCTRSSEGRC